MISMPSSEKNLLEELPEPVAELLGSDDQPRLQEDLPEEESEELPEFDPNDILADLDSLLNPSGADRLEWLKEANRIRHYQGRYTVQGAADGYDTGFVDKSNYEWFRDNCGDFLGFDGEVYIDSNDVADGDDEKFIQWLSEIPEDDWEKFTEAVDSLEDYPVLDESRMSEMEMEALDEWIKDSGVDELKKALAKKDEFQDSFAQFALDRMTLSKVFQLTRDHEAEWHYEADTVYIDMAALAEDIEVDEIFEDDDDRDIKARLRRQFDRYKLYAWKTYFKPNFRAALERHCEPGSERLAILNRMSDEHLHAFFLFLTPEDAYGTGEPAWYKDTKVLGDAHPKGHAYWTVLLDEMGHEPEALDVLAMNGAEKLENFVKAITDPNQLKLPGFESAARKRANLAENDDSLEGDDAELDLYAYLDHVLVDCYRGSDFVIYKPRIREPIIAIIGERLDTWPAFSSDEAFARRLAWVDYFLVVFHDKNAVLISENLEDTDDTLDVLAANFDIVDDLGSRPLRLLDQLRPDHPEVIQGLIQYYSSLVETEPERALNRMFQLGGPEAVRPFEDKIDDSTLPSYTLRAAVEYGLRGDYKKTARLLRSNRDEIRLAKKGVWVLFGDWTDTASLFGDRHAVANAEKLFSGDAFDWFEIYDMEHLDHKDAYRFLNSQHWNLIREALTGRSYTDEAGNELILTRAITDQWSDSELEDVLDSYQENSDLEEIVDALIHALASLEERLREEATVTGWQDCVKDVLGATDARYFTVKGKKNSGKRSDVLAFFIPYTVLKQRLDKFYEENGSHYSSSVKDLLMDTADVASPNDEYHGPLPDKDTAPDIFDLHLGELEPVPLKDDPAQAQLPLESAEQRVSSLLEDTYDKGCLMLHVPKEQADFILDWGRLHVPDDVLYVDEDGHGREDEMHVTVKFGIHLKQPDEKLTDVVNRTKAFPVRLGRISLFNTHSDYDVVKLDVESPWLRALNARIRGTVPNEETYPVYRPHCTVAYVKKGSCDHLAGQPVFGGEGSPNSTFYVYDLMYKGPGEDGDKSREHKLFLKRDTDLDEAKQPDPFEKLPFPADPSRLRKRKPRRRGTRSVCS